MVQRFQEEGNDLTNSGLFGKREFRWTTDNTDGTDLHGF